MNLNCGINRIKINISEKNALPVPAIELLLFLLNRQFAASVFCNPAPEQAKYDKGANCLLTQYPFEEVTGGMKNHSMSL